MPEIKKINPFDAQRLAVAVIKSAVDDLQYLSSPDNKQRELAEDAMDFFMTARLDLWCPGCLEHEQVRRIVKKIIEERK
jgi:hypothetical protein